jgi:hypothetical protein
MTFGMRSSSSSSGKRLRFSAFTVGSMMFSIAKPMCPDIRRERAMKVGEIDTQHLPPAVALIKSSDPGHGEIKTVAFHCRHAQRRGKYNDSRKEDSGEAVRAWGKSAGARNGDPTATPSVDGKKGQPQPLRLPAKK